MPHVQSISVSPRLAIEDWRGYPSKVRPTAESALGQKPEPYGRRRQGPDPLSPPSRAKPSGASYRRPQALTYDCLAVNQLLCEIGGHVCYRSTASPLIRLRPPCVPSCGCGLGEQFRFRQIREHPSDVVGDVIATRGGKNRRLFRSRFRHRHIAAGPYEQNLVLNMTAAATLGVALIPNPGLFNALYI
jgi:hypothetical protein